MKGRLRRLVALAVLVACAASLLTPAALASNEQPRKSQPTLKPLWSAFPLDENRQSGGERAVGEARSGQPQPSDPDHGFGTLPLVGAVAAALALLVAGGIAVVASRRRPLSSSLVPVGIDLPKIEVRLPFRPSEGGFVMSNPRRRLWARSDPDASADHVHGQPSEEGTGSNRLIDRVSEYAARESQSSTPAVDQEPLDESVASDSGAASADVPDDLSVVGDEVGAVLRSAQEAAATIRRAALEEAAKRQDEAEAAAAAQTAEARRAADAERDEANRLRAEAETYARETRASADEYAEHRRAEAERESATIIAEAEAQSRERVEMLKAESVRYEERLDDIFVVFREMSAQLEELVGARGSAPNETAGSDEGEGLEDALRPDSSPSRAT
jgi:hypothetical protein